MHLRKAVEIDPASAEAFVNLSLVLSAIQAYPEAEQAAIRALEIRPGAANSRYALAFAQAGQGRVAEAIVILRELPESPAARELLERLIRFQQAGD